ncbi:uncharacterized protein PG986_014320 [Apiospora aurea]|uniref:Uncharacterized protein n=1 Tax=Apiospora aurea TaxID=335848 RepID=A0ABR1PSY2_9PEZI
MEPYLFQDKGPQGSGLYSCISHPSFRPLVPQESADLPSIKTRPGVMTYIRKSFPFEVNPRLDLVSDPYMQILEVITPIEKSHPNPSTPLHLDNRKQTTERSTPLFFSKTKTKHFFDSTPSRFGTGSTPNSSAMQSRAYTPPRKLTVST